MSSMTASPPPVVAGLCGAIDVVADSDFGRLSDEELLDVLRQAEVAKRRLEALDHRLIAEAEARNLAGKHVMRSTAMLLSGLLKLSPTEAKVRVRRARELAPRMTISGQPLPPLHPMLAAARAAGAVTAQHGDVVAAALRPLHDRLPPDVVAHAEAFLVEQAESFDAQQLQGIARRLVDTIDPDGMLIDQAEQQRRRCLSLIPLGNGMHRLTGDLDGETSALAATVLHALAAPSPPDGQPDTTGRSGSDVETTGNGGGSDSNPSWVTSADRDERTPGQRLHDAFRAVLKLVLRCGELPGAGGIPATVLITMTAEQFETGTGLATTSYGQKLYIDQALRLADEAAIAWIVHNSNGAILNHGRTKRIATNAQTLALIARDKGCTFPGCTDPPQWTERHHIIPWRQGGTTDLDNLTLLCDYHHDHIDTHGWTVTMQDGIPWYTPPAWYDPNRKPIRNHRP
jgi:hypothetical protein